MKRTAIALVVFAGFGLGSFGIASFAQQGPRGDGAAPMRERARAENADIDRGSMGRGYEHMARLSAEDRAAFVDAHIAAVHAGLKLSAEQEKLWAPAEQAFREGFNKINAQMEQWRKERKDEKSEDALAHLRHRAEAMALHADSMRKLADAAQPLYNSLTAEQKKRLPLLIHPHEGMMGRAHHWMHERWSEIRGPRGQERALQ